MLTLFFLVMGVVFLAQGREVAGAVVMLAVGLLGVFITIAAVRSAIRHGREGW